ASVTRSGVSVTRVARHAANRGTTCPPSAGPSPGLTAASARGYTACGPAHPCRRGGTGYAAGFKTAPRNGVWGWNPPPAPQTNPHEFSDHDTCSSTGECAVDDADNDLTPTVTPTGTRGVLCTDAHRLTTSPGESTATTAIEIRQPWRFVVADCAGSSG